MRKITHFIIVCVVAVPYYVFPQEKTSQELLNISFEELFDIEIVDVSKLNLDNVSEVPSVVTIVTDEDIRNSGAKNMEEVMRLVPGFDVVKTSFDPATNLGVRGLFSTEGTNNKILFLVNDHPFRSMLNGDATVFLGNFPIQTIEQIEIIRGPGSTLYGAGAFLGVINIRTKEAEDLMEISATVGSFNTREVNATVTSRPNDDLSFTLNGSFHETDGPDLELMSDVVNEITEPVVRSFGYSGPPASATPGKLNYERLTSSLNMKTSYKDFYMLGSFMHSEDEIPVSLYEALTDRTGVTNQAAFLEGGYQGAFLNDHGEILLKGYAEQYNFDADIDIYPSQSAELLNELALISYLLNPDLMGMQPQTYESGEAFFQERTAKNNVAGAEINLAYSYGNMINVLAGFMYEKHTISNIKTISNGNFLFDQPMILGDQVFQGAESLGGTRDVSAEYNWLQERDRTIYAVFGQAEFNFKNMLKLFSFEHVKLVTGVRFDDYSDVGGKVNPRLGLLVAFSRKVYFKGLFGQAFRAPSMVELYTQNSPVADGDPNLLPETVRTFEAVLGYQAGKRLDANLTYFNTRIFDNIQLSEDDDPRTPLRAVYSNAGNLRTSGVEGEAKWWFNKKENGYLSGSFTIQNVLDFTRDTLLALNRNTGEVLTEVQGDFDPGNSPDFLLNLTLNYPITQNISLNVNANHIAERKRTEALQFEVDDAFRPTGEIIQTDNRPAIPARTLVNASVILKDLKFAPKLTFQLTGYNILDEVNDNPTFRIRGDDLLREGINWTSSLIYQF